MPSKPTLNPETERELEEEMVDEIKESYEELGIDVPMFKCNDCDSTNIFWDDHQEMDSPVMETKCEDCESESIADNHGLVAYEILDLFTPFIAKVEQRAIERERVRMNMIWEKIIIEKYPMSDSERNKIIIEYGLTPPTTNERKK